MVSFKSIIVFTILERKFSILANPAGPVRKAFPDNNGGRITGGQNAARNQFPYQVSFQWGLLGIYQHFCGASIVSPQYVLSAGHCITELPSVGNTRVVAGILNINENGVVRNVISSLVHPLYEGYVVRKYSSKGVFFSHKLFISEMLDLTICL